MSSPSSRTSEHGPGAQLGEITCCQEAPSWDAGEVCTHGHSRAGFRSRSGWEGRSWWWSPEAGNLFDSGRALCFRPVGRREGSLITFYPAMLHTLSLDYLLSRDRAPTHTPVSTCNILLPLLCPVKYYLPFEAASTPPFPQALTQAPEPDQCCYWKHHSPLWRTECLTQNQKILIRVAASTSTH